MGCSKVTIFSKSFIERKKNRLLFFFTAAGMLMFLTTPSIYAIPSFARQTGLSCNYCHYTFPSLTAFGRMFKLNGYTTTNIENLQAVSSDSERVTLQIPQTFSFSAFVKSSYTSISKGAPGLDNSFAQSPEEISMFMSGEISPRIGGYVQLTYGLSDGAIGLDMLDVRYANHTRLGGKDLLYGLTLNNMPTMEDPWNTTPAWGFPYYNSEPAPAPTAATYLQTAMGDVAGLGAYALYNKLIYADISFYHSSPAGMSYPPDATWMGDIKGAAPYWRLAIQHQWGSQYLEVGTYGIASSVYPMGVVGKTDKYSDIGFDAQFESTNDNGGSWVFHGAYISEKQNLDATYAAGGSANASNNLNSLKLDLTYNFPAWVSLTAGYFSVGGSVDAGLYAPEDITGSLTGDPSSSGEILQVAFLPWMNTQFAVQYTLYSKFNGNSSNYDGSGRNASDNNTLYVMGWLVF